MAFSSSLVSLARYASKAVSKAVTDPQEAIRLAHRESNFVGREMNRAIHKQVDNPTDFDLMDEDWDTMLILDACRFDAFAARNPFSEGRLQKVTSPGTESSEFIKNVWKDREFHDTVYISGNPFATILNGDEFHDIILDDAWDSSKKEVPPSRVTEAAKEAHEEYPNKRIIVHYMQPHFPILAPNSRWVNDKLDSHKMQYWPQETDIDSVRRGYIDNLDYVLEYAQELIDSIEGRIAITADHGELLGERQWPVPVRGFDHFEGLYHEKLLHVPWFTFTTGERRNIILEPPKKELSVDESVRNERLSALGYL